MLILLADVAGNTVK